MNKYFESAIKRYKDLTKGIKYLISPISDIDAEIFEKIISILKETNFQKDVVAILDEYKFEKDEIILSKLNNVKISNGIESFVSKVVDKVVDNNKVKFVDFIELNGELIRLKDIYGVKSINEVIYNKELAESLEVFIIILNPLPKIEVSRVPLYAEYRLEFDWEEDRDKVYNYIKENINSNYNITKLD